MTNFRIITDAAIENGLFTEEEVAHHLQTRGALPLHTFAEWKRLGFSVKKGERVKLTCFIWRFKDKKAKNEEEADGVEIADESKFYKTKAFFFTAEQVQQIAAA